MESLSGLLDYNIALIEVQLVRGTSLKDPHVFQLTGYIQSIKAAGETVLSLGAQLTSNLRKLDPKSAIKAAILDRFADVLGRDLGFAL